MTRGMFFIWLRAVEINVSLSAVVDYFKLHQIYDYSNYY